MLQTELDFPLKPVRRERWTASPKRNLLHAPPVNGLDREQEKGPKHHAAKWLDCGQAFQRQAASGPRHDLGGTSRQRAVGNGYDAPLNLSPTRVCALSPSPLTVRNKTGD